MTAYGKAMEARKKLMEHARHVVEFYRKHPTIEAKSMIQALVNTGEGETLLSDDEIIDQVILMLFAGKVQMS